MRYLAVLAVSAVTLLCSVGAINFAVDPAQLFHGGVCERHVADLLAAGTNAANVDNYDERLLQRYYVDALQAAKDILVIGSSRSMEIRSAMFPHHSLFNASVSGASIEDLISIYQMYFERGFVPKLLILGVDPWLLNEANGQTRWGTLSQEYFAARRRLGLDVQSLTPWKHHGRSKFRELLSLAYLERSLSEWTNRSDAGLADATALDVGDVPIKRADGSLAYGRAFRSAVPSKVLADAVSYATKKPAYSLGDFKGLSPVIEGTFERFVTDLQTHGVEVVLYLPPYHPETYRLLVADSEYRIIQDAERYFRDFGARHAVRVTGSYNPSDIPCDASEFFDGMHPKEPCVEKNMGSSPN